jgi:hypothetical protein
MKPGSMMGSPLYLSPFRKTKPSGALVPEIKSHLNSDSVFHFLFYGFWNAAKRSCDGA